MAVTATKSKNDNKTFKMILTALGHSSIQNLIDRLWVSAGVPTTTPTGGQVGDLTYDATNDDVYIMTATNTYVALQA